MILNDIKKVYIYKPEQITEEFISDNGFLMLNTEDEFKRVLPSILSGNNSCVIIPNTIKINEVKKYGLVEFKNYVYEKYINRKIVIVYGNCHTTVISDYLEKCVEFNKSYILYRIKPIHTISDTGYFKNDIFKKCDVFIHQSIQLENRYGEEYASNSIIKLLKKDCVVISIPNVYQLPTFLFPQFYREYEFTGRNGGTLFFRDKILDNMAENNYSLQSACEEYRHLGFFSHEYLDLLLGEFVRKVEYREKEWDIKCLDYILSNFRKQKLFYDPNHPTSELLFYITSEILNFMNIDFNVDALRNVEVTILNTYEMPIVMDVSKHFEMDIYLEDELRINNRNKVKKGKMFIDDYISQYLSCEWQNSNVAVWYRLYQKYRWMLMKINNKLEKTLSRRK